MRIFQDEVYNSRQAELGRRMQAEGVDLFFCPPSADLEYLTGTRREAPKNLTGIFDWNTAHTAILEVSTSESPEVEKMLINY